KPAIRMANSYTCEGLLQGGLASLLRRAGKGSTRTGTRASSGERSRTHVQVQARARWRGRDCGCHGYGSTRGMRVDLVDVVQRSRRRGIVVGHVGGRGSVDHVERIGGG